MFQPLELPDSDFDKGSNVTLPAGTLGSIIVWMEYEGWSRPRKEKEHDPLYHTYLETRYRAALFSEDWETLKSLEPLLIEQREQVLASRRELRARGVDI